MFEDIKNYRDIRKRYNYKMFKSGNAVFRKFSDLEAEVLQSSALDRKNKELVALGISIVKVCYGCIEYHITMAMENGATRAEITDAVAVSVVMGGATAQWPARYAFDVLDQLEKEKTETE